MTEVSQRLPALSTWMRRGISTNQEKNEENSNQSSNPYLSYAYPPTTHRMVSEGNNLPPQNNTDYYYSEEVGDGNLWETQGEDGICDSRTNYALMKYGFSASDALNGSRCFTPGILKRCIPFQDTLLSESRLHLQAIEDNQPLNQGIFTNAIQNCTEIRPGSSEFISSVNFDDITGKCTTPHTFLADQQLTREEMQYEYAADQWNDSTNEKGEEISLELLNWEQDIINLTANDLSNPGSWEFSKFPIIHME